MDTGLVLILRGALGRLRELVQSSGDVVRALAALHRATPMAARTHAQPAVPTTFGAKLAVWLVELARHLDRLDSVESRLYVVSLHGAGGTAAALGERGGDIRSGVGAHLGLSTSVVPWHASRDVIAELGFVVAAMATTAGRIGREIVDLSRPEIGEIAEQAGHHRGASSTMPQKANPISSETAIGFSHLAAANQGALLSAMRVEHERSAGEWQIEWDALPAVIASAGGALLNIRDALSGLVVNAGRMRHNLDGEGGTIMAEAAMMALAGSLGRHRAHGLVYEAARGARTEGVSLADALRSALGAVEPVPMIDLDRVLDPTSYLGEAMLQVDAALEVWSRRWT
jgi:3-carboxy-cis,cis-muconate cycloisomerase